MHSLWFIRFRRVAVILLLVLAGCAIPIEDVGPATVEAQASVSASAVSAPATVPPAVQPATVVVSAERNGRWELYAYSQDAPLQQLTHGYDPARAPALSPDGKQVAFQSRKDGNWEIYLLRLDSGQVGRLTNDLAYDGAPSWSPDGQRIAFESYRAGDLDIWVMNADGSGATNLTPKQPTADYGPAWSPSGSWIAYTSWATGRKQIMLVSPDGKERADLSDNPFDDEQPAWSPDSKRVAFVSNREGCEELTDPIKLTACQRKEVYVADVQGTRLANTRQVTFDGRSTAPAWSPDGQSISFVSPRPDRQPLYLAPAAGGVAKALDLGPLWVGSAAWTSAAIARAFPLADDPPLVIEKPVAAPAGEGHPYAFTLLPDIYLAPSYGRLSSRITTSFLALHDQILAESGRDFLGELSDMARDILATCDEQCDNLSWHKSGRAVDTRLEYMDRSGQLLLEVVREDELGETYWRDYVRASAQDGSMGEPLKDAPWDLSYHSRAEVAPDQGGVPEAQPPGGYYVDFTDLARLYGWDRISSHDDPNFDWRSNRLAMEYWHYQKTDGLDWYQAIGELYPASDITSTFDWNRAARVWQEDEMRLYFKHIPPPPSAWKWYNLLPG